MQGIEQAYCDVCLRALASSYYQLMQCSVKEALEKVKYGKGDTLSFDAIPEIIIADKLEKFDHNAIFITEETDKKTSRRWPVNPDPKLQPAMFFSDPMDRSKYFRNFLEKISLDLPKSDVKINELVSREEGIAVWENGVAEAPAAVTGATSAIAFIRRGKIIFSALLNFITRDIMVACDMGIVKMELPVYQRRAEQEISLKSIIRRGQPVIFPSAENVCRNFDDFIRFTTFLGKNVYPEHFLESQIISSDSEKFIHHKEPGGPARILYLSGLQKGYGPIGFILANGEKITEWIHWLAFIKYAYNTQKNPALKIYEISLARPRIKDGILMATAKAYSIFNCEESGRYYLDISRIKNFDQPSKFRSTIVVAPADNDKITHVMARHEYRDVGGCL